MKISDTVKVLRMFIVVFSNHLPSKDNDTATAVVQKIMTMYWVGVSSNYHL